MCTADYEPSIDVLEKGIVSLQKSINNHIEAIKEIYLILETSIIKENAESIKSFIKDGNYDILDVDEGEIIKELDKSFDFKESIFNSLFFMAISIVENALRKTEIIIENKGIDLQKCKSKIRGSNINKMFKCINKSLEISKPYPKWAKLMDYYMIRNSLIHNSGILACRHRTIIKKYKLEYDDFFNLSEAYCNGNANYKTGENIARYFPSNAYIMWVTKDGTDVFYGIIPDSIDSENDKIFAFANVKFIDNSTVKDIVFDGNHPRVCGQGTIYSPFFNGESAKYLVFEKLKRINPNDPYQYISLSFYYKPLNGKWQMLQLYGKTMDFKHKL